MLKNHLEHAFEAFSLKGGKAELEKEQFHPIELMEKAAQV